MNMGFSSFVSSAIGSESLKSVTWEPGPGFGLAVYPQNLKRLML